MQEFIARLQELCDEHNIEMPKDILDLDAYDFGVDRREAQELLQEIHELNTRECDLDETSP